MVTNIRMGLWSLSEIEYITMHELEIGLNDSDDPEPEEINLKKGDSIMVLSSNTFTLLLLDEPAIAISRSFSCPPELTDDCGFWIKTESEEAYYIGGEPVEFSSLDELIEETHLGNQVPSYTPTIKQLLIDHPNTRILVTV